MTSISGRVPVVLIVPARNEAGAIAEALRLVPQDIVDLVIVADGGSHDGTRAVAQATGARVIEAGRGYGRACWEGAVAADVDAILVFMDGDGSDPANLIGSLVGPILAGQQDFVIASRVLGERAPGSMGFHQVFIGWFIGLLIKLRYGTRFTDMCAFRAIRRSDLMALGLTEMSYGWNLEMQMRVAEARLRILEIPIPYRCRVAGASKVSGHFWGTVQASTRLVLTFLRVAVSRTSWSKMLLTVVFALACLHCSVRAQQPAPPDVDLDTFAAKRFPQPVRVGDLVGRTVLEPGESRSVIGQVNRVIQLADGSFEIVIKFGSTWGFGGREIAVPTRAMVLLGQELEVLDISPKQLKDLPTYAATGRMLGSDEVIRMGLAHPTH